jgi:general secretion pathway protein H
MRGRASDQGFSLAEMLVVLAIISLIGLVGFNGFTRQRNSESLNAVTQKIEHLAALTALRAVSTGTTASVVIDVANGIVSADQSVDPVQVPATFKISVLTGAELVQQNKIASINFYSDGTSTGGQITLEDARGSTGTITILWLTGVIELTLKSAP